MIKCWKCGRQNESGNDFSLNCGAAVEVANTTAQPGATAAEVAAMSHIERALYFPSNGK